MRRWRRTICGIGAIRIAGPVDEKTKLILKELDKRRKERPWAFYRPVPAINQFHKSVSPIRVLAGPNRGGKTTAGCAELLCYATGYNPIRDERYQLPNLTWAIALDYGNLGHVMRQKIFAMLPPGYKFYKQESIIRLPKPWGSEIHIKSADAGREKFQGAGILAAWFDEEPKGSQGEEIFGEVYARRAPGIPLRIFMTFTPLQGLSWSYRRLWNEASEERYPGVETFIFDLHDCSKAHGGFLTDEEISLIERGYSSWEREARVHGRYSIMGGRNFYQGQAIEAAKLRCEKGKRYDIRLTGQVQVVEENETGSLTIRRDPAKGHRYVIGVDCSGGIRRDSSVANVWDRDDKVCVASLATDSLAPDLFADKVVALGRYYGYALVVPETNGEHGGSVLAGIRGRHYPHIYQRQDWDKVRMEYRDEYGFRTTSRTRARIFDSVKKWLADDTVIFSELTLKECETIVVDDDLRPDHLDGCHDDSVVADGVAICVMEDNQSMKLPPWNRFRNHVSGPREIQWMGT